MRSLVMANGTRVNLIPSCELKDKACETSLSVAPMMTYVIPRSVCWCIVYTVPCIQASAESHHQLRWITKRCRWKIYYPIIDFGISKLTHLTDLITLCLSCKHNHYKIQLFLSLMALEMSDSHYVIAHTFSWISDYKSLNCQAAKREHCGASMKID